LRVLYVTLTIVIIDQISKFLVKGFAIPFLNIAHTGLRPGESIQIIGDFLRLTLVENPGMAFGIDFGNPLIRTTVTLIATVVVFYYLYQVRNEDLMVRLILALILGGAIGNLIDRMFYGVIFEDAPIFYGKVVDFIDMDFFDINFLSFHVDRFAVFNVADSAVTVGVVLMLLLYPRFVKTQKKQSAQEGQEPTGILTENKNCNE